jgi:hypothetical protein
MCGGVKYHQDGQEQVVYFPNPKAVLPVRLKSGEAELLTWGRRKGESGELPQTGWAKIESIEGHKWDRYNPHPVKIIVDAYMEKDRQGLSYWFDMKPGQFIQGLIASWNGERRVYVVTTVPTEPKYAVIHDRWPRIV